MPNAATPRAFSLQVSQLHDAVFVEGIAGRAVFGMSYAAGVREGDVGGRVVSQGSRRERVPDAGLRLKKCALSIIHCLYRVGMWNSFQSMPDPYSSGAPSPRSRLPEADENSPSTWPSVGMTRRISAGASGDSVCT